MSYFSKTYFWQQLVESMCFNQEEPSLGQFSNFSEQKKNLFIVHKDEN